MTGLTFSFPDIIGGVSSFAKYCGEALVNEHGLAVHYCATRDLSSSDRPSSQTLFRQELDLFEYESKLDNQYFVRRDLGRLLGKGCSSIICNDSLDLAAAAGFANGSAIGFVLHGDYDYYYRLAKTFNRRISRFFCVSEVIASNLRQMLPERQDDIVHFRVPIKKGSASVQLERVPDGPRLIFVGRKTFGKGFDLLVEIDKELLKRGISPLWTIVAPGSCEVEGAKSWLSGSRINDRGAIPQADLLKEYPLNDFILLPSLAEGNPICVREAMLCGVIPVVSDLPVLRESVIHDHNGIIVESRVASDWAEAIAVAYSDSLTIQKLRQTIIADSLDYDLMARADLKWFQFSLATNHSVPIKTASGSRLDSPFVPKSLCRMLRQVRRYPLHFREGSK